MQESFLSHNVTLSKLFYANGKIGRMLPDAMQYIAALFIESKG